MVAHAPPVGDVMLQSAFVAVWGESAPVVVHPETGKAANDLTVTALALEPLGRNRFALITREVAHTGGHAAAGAVSVGYLERRSRGWRRVGNWREIAWAGESGGGNLTIAVRRDLGATPLLLVNGSHLGQGYLDGTAVIVRLARDGPKVLGRIPTFARYDGSPSDVLETFSYRSRIVPTARRALFEVRYAGWEEPSAGAPRRPFRARARFSIRDGCLAIETPVALPGERPSPEPEDCPAKDAPT